MYKQIILSVELRLLSDLSIGTFVVDAEKNHQCIGSFLYPYLMFFVDNKED